MKWVNFSNTFYENFLEPEKGNFEIFLICFSRKSLISHYKRAMWILIDANKIANKKHSKLQVGYSAASANKKKRILYWRRDYDIMLRKGLLGPKN